MGDITAIWFDLDDTLYDHTFSVRRGMEAIRARYPMFAQRSADELAILYNRVLNLVYTAHVRGEIDFREMRRRKLKLFYEAVGVKQSEAPPTDEFHRTYDEAYCRQRRATPGSIEILERLRDGGISVAILTNGKQAIQEEKLRLIGLEWMIPNLLTAERAGVTKPDSVIYEWALNRTRQKAGNVLMVGDNLENDVEGALCCGLNAALYAPDDTRQSVATAHGSAPVINEWNHLLHLVGDRHAISTAL